MRVLVIAESLDLPERYLLKGLAERGVEIELLLNSRSLFSSEIPGVSVGVRPIPLRSRIDGQAIAAIRQRLRGGGFDVVHCLRNNRPISNAVIASFGLRPRIVAYRETGGRLHRLDPGSWLTYLNPKISRLVCASDSVRGCLSGLGVPPSKLVTIPKGHNVAWYAREQRGDLSEFGIPSGAFVVGCAANMRRDKGVDVLIRAFRWLPQNGSFHLLLAGEVRDQRVARLLREETPRGLVHAPGFRRDAAHLMGLCDTFVMPSLRREGLPRAVIEAMAQGVPPIVTRAGGLPELVQDGVSGVVIPPGNETILALAMAELANARNHRLELGRNARLRIQTEFSIERTIERTFALYEDMVRRDPPRPGRSE